MKFFLPLMFIFCGYFSNAQIGITAATPWRFMKGDSVGGNPYPIYGTQGQVAEGNKPGARSESTQWKDAAGNLWLFGGKGKSSVDEQIGFDQALLNDLWKYDVSINQWLFIKGDNILNRPGVYGIRGVASPDNKPGSRKNAMSWIDASGNLWMFGGYGYYTGGAGYLNDLWKYDPIANQWTWVNGDNSKNVAATPGSIGIPGSDNDPGGREAASSWIDNAGKFWLFGGSTGAPRYNDVWKFDPDTNQWTWIKGSTTSCTEAAYYGTQGVENVLNRPACRSYCASWKDNTGNFWLYGGEGVGGNYSDLWKFNVASRNWIYVKGDTVKKKKAVYGTRGVSSLNNNPGARARSATWKDNSGNFWLFGGNDTTSSRVYDYFNDLWKFDVVSSQWTWYKGDNNFVHYGIYGTKEIPAAANKPGSRSSPAAWTDNAGKLWMLGGYTDHLNRDSSATVQGNYNDLWRYDLALDQYTWIKADSILNVNGSYGEAGYVFAGARTGIRTGSSSWKDNSGNLWLFGGSQGRFYNSYNDLWKYDASRNQWIWMKGSNVYTANSPGSYGTKGVEASANNPAVRFNSASWKDAAGNFWIFGGSAIPNGNDQTLDDQYNDLWKFNPVSNNWTWMSGDNAVNLSGIYGVKGFALFTTKPGARHDAATWTDASGNLWLFGGEGFAKSGTRGQLNDLWKYSISNNQWTWVNGDSSKNVLSVYGTKGSGASTNKPGGRSQVVVYTDDTGNFWFYGGYGFTASAAGGSLSDMWRYSPSQNLWTWMQGVNTINAAASWGTIGVSASSNTPGSREDASAWTDASNTFWLFGGASPNGPPYYFFTNDLWKYNTLTNEWTWVRGNKTAFHHGENGIKGVTSPVNDPISKEGATTWIDNNGDLWMHGGCTNFRDYAGTDEYSKYSISTNQWTWVNGVESFVNEGGYGSKGISSRDNNPPGRTESSNWIDQDNNLYLFGGKAKSGTEIFPNDLWKYNPLNNQWSWIKGDSSVTSYPNYGTEGIENVTNIPGGSSSPAYWKDTSGNFWLYGGGTSGNANAGDLWRYRVNNNMWTCIKFPQFNPSYGVKGVASATNTPGGRTEAMTWTDDANNLWLFGGITSSGPGQSCNDLWKYNISTNLWTWVAGDTTRNVSGIYGTKNVSSIFTKPGGRTKGTTWFRNGNLYLFGGRQYPGISQFKNDLWKYNIDSNRWTWIHGDTTVNSPGIAGTSGVSSVNTIPSSRMASSVWKDIAGRIWLYGGYTYNSETSADLWKYDPAINQWTYIDGNNLLYGKPNRPGSKNTGLAWADKSGNLWLFGGRGYGTTGFGYMNDLWKIYTGSTFIFNGTGTWGDTNQWVNHLGAPTFITPGMDVTIDHLIPGSCTNNGNVTLQQNGILRVESGKTLTINQGNLFNSGYIDGPGNLPGKIAFTGTNINQLSSSGAITAPLQLTPNKKLVLGSNSNTGRVELAAGSKLTLNNYNLNLDTSALITTSTSFVVTNDTGKIMRTVGTSPVIFNIGSDSISYSPVTITNSGVTSNFQVRVVAGANNRTSSTTGNVNRTWFIGDSGRATITSLKFEWLAADEQAFFDRTNAYVAQSHACQPPPNCTDIYYDITTRSAAQGTNPYSLTRSNIVAPSSFVIKSGPDISTFTGNGSWDDPNNWTIGIVPDKIIGMGRELIIDPSAGGECVVTGNITIQHGGTLTVKPGKVLKVSGRIILE